MGSPSATRVVESVGSACMACCCSGGGDGAFADLRGKRRLRIFQRCLGLRAALASSSSSGPLDIVVGCRRDCSLSAGRRRWEALKETQSQTCFFDASHGADFQNNKKNLP